MDVEIVVPSLRLKHLSSAQLLLNAEKVSNVVALLSEITGVEKKTFYRMSYASLNAIVKAIVDEIVSITNDTLKPAQRLRFREREFSLLDPAKVTVGWMIDYSQIDKSNHSHIAALLYVPSDKRYREDDFFERAKIFNEEMSVRDYFAAVNFFLNYLKAFTALRNLMIAKKKN